jgi:SepF-like predicted cell division protein (DUF552 family)
MWDNTHICFQGWIPDLEAFGDVPDTDVEWADAVVVKSYSRLKGGTEKENREFVKEMLKFNKDNTRDKQRVVEAEISSIAHAHDGKSIEVFLRNPKVLVADLTYIDELRDTRSGQVELVMEDEEDLGGVVEITSPSFSILITGPELVEAVRVGCEVCNDRFSKEGEGIDDAVRNMWAMGPDYIVCEACYNACENKIVNCQRDETKGAIH